MLLTLCWVNFVGHAGLLRLKLDALSGELQRENLVLGFRRWIPDCSYQWTVSWSWGNAHTAYNPIDLHHSQDAPKNVTATNGLPTSANGDTYTFSFGNYHGAATPRPGLAKFLFDCEYGLFGQTPASGRGVQTPYPRGKYICRGDINGVVDLRLIGNRFGWSLTIHDIAFLIKVMHEIEGVKDGSRYFDFVVNYTNESDLHPYETVAYGKWESTGAITAVTSSR